LIGREGAADSSPVDVTIPLDGIDRAIDFTRMIDGSGSPPQLGHLARFTASGYLDQTFHALPGANGPIYYLERQFMSPGVTTTSPIELLLLN
jgi:hypothetical protein